MAKRRKIFKKLVGIEKGNKKWQVKRSSTVQSESWLHHILPGDHDAPQIEAERNFRPFIFLASFVVLFLFLVVGRVGYLQLYHGEKNYSLAEGNRIRENLIRAPRGIIYDINNKKLVKNVPHYELSIIPSDLPESETDRQKIYNEVANFVEVDVSEISQKIEEKDPLYSYPVPIKEDLSKEEAFIVYSKSLKGVSVSVNPTREYLDRSLLSHVLGYVGRINKEELEANKDKYKITDYIGKSGLEKSYEDVLKGEDGGKRYEVNSTGQVVKYLGQEDPKLGDNLVLEIDLELQKKISDALDKSMEEVDAQKASAVAMNPKTGGIMALVNKPSYNNNLFAGGISEKDYQKLLEDERNPLLARAISGEYPSGSTIKPFVATAALEEGTINQNTTVNSTGGIEVGEFYFPDWKSGGHGITNVTKAIAESVNTFFYAIGGGYENIEGLGPEVMKKYLNKFNFGEQTGISIEGEASGSIPDPVWKEKAKNEPWYLGDTYHMAIGQGDVLVTPLQIANATCAIANDGTLYEPRLVNKLVDENNNLVEKIEPKVIREDFVSGSSLNIVKEGMRKTVTEGSGRALKDVPGEIAGKTGTAQFGPDNSKEHGWFTSFAPYNNPEIVLTVLVEGSGGGDETAVPVARDVYKWYFSKENKR